MPGKKQKNQSTPKRFYIKVGRYIVAVILVFGLIGASYAAYCGILISYGNFHTVEKGQVYRSGQLNRHQLAGEIADHRIKSILNLRGPNVGSPWYDEEITVAHEDGVTHYDVGISARRLVAPEKISQILTILRDAPKPILIHCKSGSDRTGLVSALYRYTIEGQNPTDAEHELSLMYGHFPYLVSKSGAMDQSFNIYVQKNLRLLPNKEKDRSDKGAALVQELKISN
jgi:protein tyrosine phosphatase (PTP) superfamily phosphohydrolase (DUF442 family)